MEKYNFNQIELKWQKIWEQKNSDIAQDFSKKEKYYCLDMFPYPSGEGLHVGHWRGYVFSDVWSRYQKMIGKNVLHPMGFDSFGLPAENAAIKNGIAPQKHIDQTINKMKVQLRDIGAMYDWSREIITSNPNYYKWTQWLFLQLFNNGLAYKKEAFVNFCPSCKTVLANEQVKDGRCERCDSVVGKKKLEQWFFKITKYAEKLLSGLDKIDWPGRVKTMQQNWIGRSEGILVKFQIQNSKFQIEVFTTRIDTIYGVTYLALAPENSIVNKILQKSQKSDVVKYIRETLKVSEIERSSDDRVKTGVFTGSYAINPANGHKIPIWVADYVLANYGSGAIMGVPAHDSRDFEFAKKYKLPIIQVIKNPKNSKKMMENAYEGEGIMVNCEKFNNLTTIKFKTEIFNKLSEENIAKKTTLFKLHDWLISRQRYWGAPIPIIYCQKCGIVGVSEADLPVKLPDITNYLPTEGKSPLDSVLDFVNIKCPKCQGPAKREMDTMDTFVCSSWYYLRFASPNEPKFAFDKNLVKYWLPVDFYVGGIEHATMHLLYARFISYALNDLGLINFQEPFSKLFNIGMIYLNGVKMSKSKGNVVSPDEIIAKYGRDTLRGYELFIGPAEEDSEWNAQGASGIYRFLTKVYNLVLNYSKSPKVENDSKFEIITHQLIKKYNDDLNRLNFNTLISHLMLFVNKISQNTKNISSFQIKTLILLLSPIAPHLGEELWSIIGEKNSVFSAGWPTYDKNKITSDNFMLVVQINGKVRSKLEISSNLKQVEIEKEALKDSKIKNLLASQKIIKTIYIPLKLINFVVR